jgi:hypothetical protein
MKWSNQGPWFGDTEISTLACLKEVGFDDLGLREK